MVVQFRSNKRVQQWIIAATERLWGQIPGPLNLAKQQRRGFYFQFILGLFHLGHISWFCLFSDVLITSCEVVCVYIDNSKCISWDTIELKNWWIDNGHHINQVDGFEIMTIMLSSLQKTASDKDGQTICSLYVLSYYQRVINPAFTVVHGLYLCVLLSSLHSRIAYLAFFWEWRNPSQWPSLGPDRLFALFYHQPCREL